MLLCQIYIAHSTQHDTCIYYNYNIKWLGWAYLTQTVRKPQYRGLDFDPPMIFCACSMQNTPGGSEIHQDDFRIK